MNYSSTEMTPMEVEPDLRRPGQVRIFFLYRSRGMWYCSTSAVLRKFFYDWFFKLKNRKIMLFCFCGSS